jgi:hypothetical protein
MRNIAIPLFVAAVAAGACSRDEGNHPVGGSDVSVLEQQRFLRRMHLDLGGVAPSDDVEAAALERLGAEGNTAATRGAMARELIDQASFATVFVTELESRAFEGDSVEARYAFMCAVQRQSPPCTQCVSSQPDDPCSNDCACNELDQFSAERDDLMKTRDDFAAGASTASIERRYARTQGFQFPLAPEGVADLLFETFLGRPVEPDEERNTVAMIFGALIPGTPAGLLFHRHGSSYQDLIDIVFAAEAYREAAVDRVFMRYLGRRGKPAELRHFAAGFDAADPDLRAVIAAVVSSQEYFQQ